MQGVSRYIGKRSLQSIPVLFAVTVVAFSLIHFVPGDPARLMLGSRATDETVAVLREQMGLNKALVAQYVDFVVGAARLDFGQSLFLRTAVGPLVWSRTLNSAALILAAIAVSLVIAVPGALISARRRNRIPDHVVRLFTTITFAMPSFWVGLLLVLVFSIRLGLFPTSGLGSATVSPLRALVLPAVTIGLYLAPVLLRSLRSSLIDTLSADFVEAARARGLGPSRVTVRHVLRNSLIAMITILGVNIGFLISGAVVIENVFSIPGLGSLMVSSIVARDYPVIVAVTLVFGVIVVIANLLVDVSYAVLDPRIRP